MFQFSFCFVGICLQLCWKRGHWTNRALGLMQYGLCYIVHQTIECGFAEAAVCPTRLFLL